MRRVLAYAAIYLLWGGTYLAVRTVVLVTPPFAAAALRFLLSGLILFGISRVKREPWPSRRAWGNTAMLGFFMFTINYACFFWAEQRLYSGVAAVLVATLPVWMMIAEWLLTRKPLSLASAAGFLLGIGGVILVSQGGARQASSHAETGRASLVLIAGTICWAAGSVWSRSGRLLLPASQMVRAALPMITGGLLLAVLAAATGESRALVLALRHWTWAIWLCFAYLLAASIVAFTAYLWLLEREPAERVASYAYVNPLVALALGLGLAHEHIGQLQVLGAGLVLLSVFTALRTQRVAAPARKLAEVSLDEI